MSAPEKKILSRGRTLLILLFFLFVSTISIDWLLTRSLQDPFTDVLKKLNVTDPFVTNWLNLLCFLLQGLPSDGTTTAVMAYMIADWCRPVSDGRGCRRWLLRCACCCCGGLCRGGETQSDRTLGLVNRTGTPLPFSESPCTLPHSRRSCLYLVLMSRAHYVTSYTVPTWRD